MKSFSVSEFIDYFNLALNEAVFPDGVFVEGEVSEYRVSQGKWIWFLLKDGESVISCFGTSWQLRSPLEDGMRVRVYGRPKIFAKSGKLSLTVERSEPVGVGALKRAFELLKAKLEKEGLFDQERKRPLPKYPKRIGLIASTESAAYSDFLRILSNRWGGIEIYSFHVQVQGESAVQSIVSAFDYFNKLTEEIDVLVLTRGGGSQEDLQAFNSEDVVRAIFSARVPVVVAVGHERDESLSDYVADVRASTPSNAAEIAVPNRADIIIALNNKIKQLNLLMDSFVKKEQDGLSHLIYQLKSESESSTLRLSSKVRDLYDYFFKFINRTKELTATERKMTEQLFNNFETILLKKKERVDNKSILLKQLNPENVLRRGYAVVRRENKIIHQVDELSIGDNIKIKFNQGSVSATVDEVLSK